MVKPMVVAVSPNKSNIKYEVMEKPDSAVDAVFTPLVEEIKAKRSDMEKTIVFCRTYNSCCEVYMFMAGLLGRYRWSHLELIVIYLNIDY